MKKSLGKGRTVLLLLIVLTALILVIVYANGKNVPVWSDVYGALGGIADKNYSDEIVFLDVGQGDSAYLKSGDKNAVIDLGTPEGAEKLLGKIKGLGATKIDAVLLTHNHDDHIGGVKKITEMMSVENVLLPDVTNTKSPTKIIKTVMENVGATGGKCYTAKSGAYFKIGDIKVTVLCQYTELSNENDRSIVAIADMYGKRFLFTGDAGKQAENKILKDNINVDCDVLKVGHHGSGGSSTDKFLAAVSPQYAVISCGEGNSYNHPHEDAIKRIEQTGAKIYRTDINGDITFYLNGKALSVETQK